MKTLFEKNFNGGIVVSDIIEGIRIHRVYYGYSMKEIKADLKLKPLK